MSNKQNKDALLLEEKDVDVAFDFIDEGSTCRLLVDFIGKSGKQMVTPVAIG
jgi:hypothetical protein